jgi:hypothetical protein
MFISVWRNWISQYKKIISIERNTNAGSSAENWTQTHGKLEGFTFLQIIMCSSSASSDNEDNNYKIFIIKNNKILKIIKL